MKDKNNIIFSAVMGIILIILTVAIYAAHSSQGQKINELESQLNATESQLNATIAKLSNLDKKLIAVSTSPVRAKGDEASCNDVCTKASRECVFGQIATVSKLSSDNGKLVDCDEDYSKADWLKPYTLNCMCRQKS